MALSSESEGDNEIQNSRRNLYLETECRLSISSLEIHALYWLKHPSRIPRSSSHSVPQDHQS